jgi:NAD(P)-dependent dehydrogenase (short-subunit alcohol dehydrogenase family)
MGYQADVSKSDEVKAMVDHCIDTDGRIDVLYNNVGIAELGGPVEASEESWDHVSAVNIKSFFLTCKYVLPHMERRGGGFIVNMSSKAAIRAGEVVYVSYNATKAGIVGFTISVAIQCQKRDPGQLHPSRPAVYPDVGRAVQAVLRRRNR